MFELTQEPVMSSHQAKITTQQESRGPGLGGEAEGGRGNTLPYLTANWTVRAFVLSALRQKGG